MYNAFKCLTGKNYNPGCINKFATSQKIEKKKKWQAINILQI